MYRHPEHLAVVIDEDSGSAWVLVLSIAQICQLPQSSYAIWVACDGAVGSEEVIQRLVEWHGWARETISAPVREFIEELINRGLVVEGTQ